MKIRHLWLFALGVIMIVSMNSCTKTVVQTTVDSVKVIDTVRDTVGLCGFDSSVCFRNLMRRRSIFTPQGIRSQPDPAYATNNCPNTYFPVSL